MGEQEAAPKTWSPAGPVERLDVMIVGDTSFGENYQERRAASGRENVLETRGYDHGFARLDGLLDETDLVIANLEAPLTTRRASPFADVRPYLHYSDPVRATKHLLTHGIRAVTLANNHTHDFGAEGLLDTLRALDDSGLIGVGAGHTEREANEPLRIRATVANPDGAAGDPFRMSLYSAFWGGRQFERDLQAYASADRPGSAKLQSEELAGRIERLRHDRPDEFVVVTPHWRRDYQWRSERQVRTARELTAAGADLVIGHGSHMMQEIEKVNGRWVLHGIGNFVFHSPGRYRSLGAPPYSLLARLTVSSTQVLLRLYPIVSDNRRTGYQPRPVSAAELNEVWALLLQRTNAPAEFRREFALVGTGPYPHLAVVAGQRGTPAAAAAGLTAAARARPDQHRTGRRPRNAALIAAELERRGIDVTRLDANAMVAEVGGARLGYGFGTTHATGRSGVTVAQHRGYARRLLAGAGLDVPRGRTFDGEAGVEDAATFGRDLGEVVLTRPERRSVRQVVVDAKDPEGFRAAWAAAVASERGARVLVEQRFVGTAARFLVVGGRCVAVAGYSGPAAAGSSRSAGPADAVHPSFRHIAARAALAFPGLDVAAVTIAATDFRRKCEPGHYVVWEVEPQPALADYSTGAESGPGGVAAAVVDLHLGVTAPAKKPPHPYRRGGTGVADPAPGFPAYDNDPIGAFYNVGAHLLALEWKRRGAEVTWLSRRLFVADIDGVRLGYHGATTHATGRFATNLASRKDLTRQVLSLAGLEVVEGMAFPPDGYVPAATFADKLGYVVVKPIDGNKGKGVTVGVRDEPAFERAWRRAVRHSRHGVLVEQVFSGTELRCLVVGDRCVAVLRRLPPHVVGNGQDTVEQLIAAKNELRKQNPSLPGGRPIRMDPHRRDELRRQGYGMADVLPDGVQVVLDHKGNISTGGESVDLTDEVHPSLKEAAVRATLAVPGLDVAGVDILTADPRQPAGPGSYMVCEINTDPGIDVHHFPIHGTPRDVAGAMVDFHLTQLGIGTRR